MRRYYTKKAVYFRRILTLFIISITLSLASVHFMLKQYADAVCQSSCSQYGQQIINKAVSDTLQSFDLDGLIINGGMQNSPMGYSVDSNMVNEISAYLIESINDSLSEDICSQISVPAGAFTGISFLSGSGPGVSIDIYAVGSPEIKLSERFETAGINQSLYELYAEISISFSAVMPAKSVTVSVNREVLLAQKVIIGDIPQFYYPSTE